jgi:hypothetical protein
MLAVTRTKLISALKKLLLLFVLYFAQCAFARLRLGGVSPLLLPAAAIGVSMFVDGQWGALWGLLAGILCDVSVGDYPLMCTLTLCAAGLAVGFLTEFFFARTFVTYLVFSLITLAVLSFEQIIPMMMFKGVAIEAVLPVVVVQMAYSAVFIVPIYFLCRRLCKPKNA